MNSGPFAILDPAAGLSGDMLLGALVDAGAPASWLEELPARLGFPDVRVHVERVTRCGVAATKVSVRLPGDREELPNPDYVGPHAHGAGHEDSKGHDHAVHGHHAAGDHRHLADLLAVVDRAPLSSWVRERAAAAFRLLCEEEGRIHGVPASAVALHEVGAVDAIVDIIGGIEGFERLGVTRVFHRPLAVGSGWVRAAHGVMSVPTPVTARLLEGIEIGPNGPVTGEATTPTGAVLLRILGSGAPPDRWRGVASGWGAGTRDPELYPNALRLILASSAPEASHVVTLSTDLDDLSPEYLEPLREALMAAGALDVQLWGTQMKKGRLGFRIEAICDTAAEAAVIAALFLHSTTSGIRRTVAERITLPRRQIEVEAGDGSPIRVKVVETPAGPRVKPEYDDVSAAARRLGRPAHELAREIEARARALLASRPVSAPRTGKEQE